MLYAAWLRLQCFFAVARDVTPWAEARALKSLDPAHSALPRSLGCVWPAPADGGELRKGIFCTHKADAIVPDASHGRQGRGDWSAACSTALNEPVGPAPTHDKAWRRVG